MKDDDLTEVWRRSRRARAVGCFMVFVSLLMSIATALGAVGPNDMTPPADVRAAGAVFLAVIAIGVWRLTLHPLVGTTAAGIVVRNPVRSYFVAWAEIAAVVPWDFGLIIRRHTGRPVFSIALAKKTLGWSLRNRRAKEAARALENRFLAEQSGAISQRRLGKTGAGRSLQSSEAPPDR